MNDRDKLREDRLTRVQPFGTENAADIALGNKAKTLFGRIDQHLLNLAAIKAGKDDITEDGIRAVLADCAATRNFSGSAAQATTAKTRITAAEALANETLLGILRNIQARARQKHLRKNPALLRDCGIGQDLTASRDLLEQYAAGIHQLTATDKLPKTPKPPVPLYKPRLPPIKNRRPPKTAAKAPPPNSAPAATSSSPAPSLAAWKSNSPPTPNGHLAPANHAVRIQFQLPSNRPFVG